MNYLCPKNTPDFNQNKQNSGKVPNEIINTKRHYFTNSDGSINPASSMKKNFKTNESSFINEDKKSFISKGYYGDDNYNESILKIGSQLKKNEINIYKVLLGFDKEFKGKLI